MAQAVLRVEGLADSPLAAAATFHTRFLESARDALEQADSLTIVFPPADHTHRAWRLAAVQELAREAAPKRVNAVAGGDQATLGEILAFLEIAPGVTGQLLVADGKSDEKG